MTRVPDDWGPTCSLAMLRLRADLLQCVREWFRLRDYLEVETPLLSHDIVVDSHLHPYTVQTESGTRYLQTSPEAAMKRLLAAGSGPIFQITRSFRKGESGDRHNPEFTMLEWYGLGMSDVDQMRLTEELVRMVFTKAGALSGRGRSDNLLEQPFRKTSYDAAMSTVLGISVLDLSADELLKAALAAGVTFPESLNVSSRDDILNVVLASLVEPKLGLGTPEFLYDYPASQAALARISPQDSRVARRFELYCVGVELCNGYYELTDPAELAERDRMNNASRETEKSEQLPGATRMLAAMQHGLPECSGVALGFDRLLMVATGMTCLDQVIPFPFSRA